MQERRRALRIAKSLCVSYQRVKSVKKSGSRNLNISSEGICLPVDQNLEVGTILEIELSALNMQKSITALGKVVWMRRRDDVRFPFEVGLEFREISDADKETIRALIKKLIDEGGPDISWMVP